MGKTTALETAALRFWSERQGDEFADFGRWQEDPGQGYRACFPYHLHFGQARDRDFFEYRSCLALASILVVVARCGRTIRKIGTAVIGSSPSPATATAQANKSS